MEAPDVIYLEKFPSGTIGVVWNDNIEDCGKNEPIMYIRKDALMEWIGDKMKDTENSQFDIGYRCAMRDLIDKLNSM